MLFHSLKLVVGIGRWISVIQTGDETDVENVGRHAIDESAAEGLRRERIPQRMNDCPRLETIVRKLPELFDAGGVDLRLASLVKIQTRHGLLCKASARSFTEHDDFRHDIRARFVIRLGLTVMVEPLIAGTHADEAILVPKQLLTGKGRKNLRGVLLGDVAQPFTELL